MAMSRFIRARMSVTCRSRISSFLSDFWLPLSSCVGTCASGTATASLLASLRPGFFTDSRRSTFEQNFSVPSQIRLMLDLACASSRAMASYLRVASSFRTGPGPPLVTLNSFTRSAYLRVFRVCSHAVFPGEMQAIMTVALFPLKLSLSTCVRVLPRKGMCPAPFSRARMHSLRARRDLLISAPSARVCLSLSAVSAPLSFPARSMKLMRPNCSCVLANRMTICRMACERLLSLFAAVLPLLRCPLPWSITFIRARTFSTRCSVRPTMLVTLEASSRANNFFLEFSRSYRTPW
mmetsp:Transcript_153425/g.268272  ORF Transcript_153425/g.268272 Transcript_153425/m.268272 type:complete len:293 (+) Transcript_153425:309-1187(+)